jgi:hypothetical protein
VTTGNTGTVGVGFLMAAGAVQTRNTFAFRTTHDIRDVTSSFITLLRIFGCGVTIDATRVCQDRVDLLPRGETLRGADRLRHFRTGVTVSSDRQRNGYHDCRHQKTCTNPRHQNTPAE